jgi:sec-independent protein translocase protein TatB
MFDIGFSELLMVAVVALVVIGPERLPGVARNVGRFAGRLQRYVHDIKKDFNREVEFEEIKRLQHEMETTVQSMQESMRAVESTLQQETLKQQSELSEAVALPHVDQHSEQPALTQSAQTGQSAKSAKGDRLAKTDVAADAKTTPQEDQLSLF